MSETKNQKGSRKKWLLIVLAVLLVVLIAFGISFFATRPTGQRNYLLLGYDGWGKITTGQGRTDTMLMVTMDFDRNQWLLTSFQRDAQATAPSGTKVKMNTLAQRGEEVLVAYIQDTYGVEINGVISTNFTGMVLLIDEIGGITVELTEQEAKHLRKTVGDYAGFALHEGACRINGAQTLGYMRIRALDSDYGRTNRQANTMNAVKERAKQISLTQALSLLGNVQNLYATDLSLAEQAALVRDAYRLRSAPMQHQQIPAPGAYGYGELNGTSVLRFDEGKNRIILRDFLGLPNEE